MMDIEQKLELVRRWIGSLTVEEEASARSLLAAPFTIFAGSNSPSYVARLIDVQRRTRKQAA